MSDKENWLDFQKIKDTAKIERVLGHYGILEHLERRGDELVGWCPLGEEHGKGDSFAFNTAKKSFQCFSCKARGSILDFVRKHDGSDLRTAALRVQEIMGDEASPSPASPAPAKKTRPYNKKPVMEKSTVEESSTPLLPVQVFRWEEALALIEKKALDPKHVVVVRATPLPSTNM